jgi:chromosome condensin MukBEF complex kleisin-like MukF subunit
MANGMTIKINTEDGTKEFSVMELWDQSYNDYRYTNTFFDQLKEYTSIIGTVENNIINNLLRGRLDRYFKTTVTRPGTISTTMTDNGNGINIAQRSITQINGTIQTIGSSQISSNVRYSYPTIIRISNGGSSIIKTRYTFLNRYTYPTAR